MANSRNTVPVDTLTSWVRGEIEKYIADATHFHKDTPGAQDFLDKLTEYAGSAPDYDDVGFFFQDAVGDSCVGAWVKYDATMEQLQDSVADSRRVQALQEENRDVFSAFREAILDYRWVISRRRSQRRSSVISGYPRSTRRLSSRAVAATWCSARGATKTPPADNCCRGCFV